MGGGRTRLWCATPSFTAECELQPSGEEEEEDYESQASEQGKVRRRTRGKPWWQTAATVAKIVSSPVRRRVGVELA